MNTFIAIAALMAVAAGAVVAWPLLRRGGRKLLPAAAVVIFVLASGFLYTRWSNWDWSGQKQIPPEGAQIEAMVGRLEQKLAANPNDLQGWLMLGRSYLTLERFDDAMAAYDHALKLGGGNDAEAALGMGEAISMRAGGQIIPPAAELFETALKLAPQNPKALLFGGFVAANRGDKALARSRWEALKAMNPPPQLVQMLDARLASLDAAPAAAGPQAAVSNQAGGPTPGAPTADDSGAQATVAIKLAPAVSDRAKSAAALFVFASEPGVRGPPLAVKRLSLADIGAPITLSAADSMMPSRTLKSGQSVTITARISFSGQPTSSAGDLYGELTYNVGHDGTRELLIDRVAQ
jgi:cytochrome c-type biogenesis protein CcmH